MELPKKFTAGLVAAGAILGAGCTDSQKVAAISQDVQTAITASPDNAAEILKQRVEQLLRAKLNVNTSRSFEYTEHARAFSSVLEKQSDEVNQAIAEHVESLKEKIRQDARFAAKFKGLDEDQTQSLLEEGEKSARLASIRSWLTGTITAISYDLNLAAPARGK